MKIISPSFGNNEMIPAEYTCDGADVNPTLKFIDVPEDIKSLALIVDDPDAPGKTWTHWVVLNIPPETEEIHEDSVPEGSLLAINDFGHTQWGGPCPPLGTHRYRFRLYALDGEPDFEEDMTSSEIEEAIKPHVIDEASLVGLYSRE